MSRYLHRYIKLINQFGKEDVLVIATGEIDVNEFPDYNIKSLKLFKYHDRFEVLKVIYYELFFGFWICLKTSIQVNLNLFQESNSIIKTLIQYKSLFKSFLKKGGDGGTRKNRSTLGYDKDWTLQPNKAQN